MAKYIFVGRRACYFLYNYVPIMRKAAAIVAEEGGLTAHVSLVSREFGIPCVVGIGTITKAVKDGDIIEVDATRGVVKRV